MGKKLLLYVAIFICFIIISKVYADEIQLYQRISQLNKSEIEIFKKVKEKCNDMYISNNVIRYFTINQKTKIEETIKVDMLFENDKGSSGYFGKYTNYALTYYPKYNIMQYLKGESNSYEIKGTIYIGEKLLIVEEFCSYNTACKYELRENENILFSE